LPAGALRKSLPAGTLGNGPGPASPELRGELRKMRPAMGNKLRSLW